MSVPLELCQFEATDHLVLPGLLYRPQRSRRVAIYLHGCGTSSVFYKGEFMNLAAKILAREGISFFSFNNRGAHLIHKLSRRNGRKSEKAWMGTGFERIRECVHDIDGAIRFLRRRGFKEFYLIGHSTGANKIVLYDSLKRGKTPVEKYILFGGGDDSGIFKFQLKKKFDKYLRISKRFVNRGEGARYVPVSWLGIPYSYQALADIMEPGGDYDLFPFRAALRKRSPKHFRRLSSIKKPTLVLYGDRDEANFLPIEECLDLLKSKVSRRANFEFVTVPGGDHSCSGKERELFQEWVKFLAS